MRWLNKLSKTYFMMKRRLKTMKNIAQRQYLTMKIKRQLVWGMVPVKPSFRYSLNKTKLFLRIPLRNVQLSVQLVKVGNLRPTQNYKNKNKVVSIHWVELPSRIMADPQELQQATIVRENRSQVYFSLTKSYMALRHPTKIQMLVWTLRRRMSC